MKEICEMWKLEMAELRRERKFQTWERRLMWGILITLLGVKPYLGS